MNLRTSVVQPPRMHARALSASNPSPSKHWHEKLSLCGAIPKSSQLCSGSVPPTLKLLSRHEEIKHRQAHDHRRGSHERRGTVGSRPARSLSPSGSK